MCWCKVCACVLLGYWHRVDKKVCAPDFAFRSINTSIIRTGREVKLGLHYLVHLSKLGQLSYYDTRALLLSAAITCLRASVILFSYNFFFKKKIHQFVASHQVCDELQSATRNVALSIWRRVCREDNLIPCCASDLHSEQSVRLTALGWHSTHATPPHGSQ